VVRQDDVLLGLGGELARRARGLLSLDPGGVEELDNGEREQDEQKDDPGDEHDHGEEAAQIALEGDVTEAERRHDRERPVEARQPAVLPAFPHHDVVEERAVDGHESHEHHEKAQQHPDVSLGASLVQEMEYLGGDVLHETPRAVRAQHPPSSVWRWSEAAAADP
jgi:hypothetical protein